MNLIDRTKYIGHVILIDHIKYIFTVLYVAIKSTYYSKQKRSKENFENHQKLIEV